MKIAVIPTIRDWPWGAPGACMGALVDKLLLVGQEVLWLVASIDLGHPEVLRLAAAGAKVMPLPEPAPSYVTLPGLRRQMDAWLGRRRSVRDVLHEYLPDHIFVNQGGTWSALADDELYACLQHWQHRYSLICHLNLHQPPFPPPLLAKARRLVSGARCMFFNSRWIHHLAETQMCGRIPQAVFFQYPLRFSFAAPLQWPDNEVPHLAMVNRLDVHHKGIDIALRAIGHLKSEGVSLKLGIYGSGPDREYLLELAEFLRLNDVVTLHGYRDDVDAVWKTEELLLLPSRFEGLAVSMLEAMSLGRPVLRTPYGGAAEWIEDGINGYLCPAAEEEPLYQAMRRALADRPRWRELGLRAHEKVTRDLHPDPARAFLCALFGEVA